MHVLHTGYLYTWYARMIELATGQYRRANRATNRCYRGHTALFLSWSQRTTLLLRWAQSTFLLYLPWTGVSRGQGGDNVYVGTKVSCIEETAMG